MPDGDMFAKRLSRKWVKPARLAFGAEDDSAAVDACEKEIARDVNARPWNGLAEAVRDIAAAMTAEDDPENRRRALTNLEWYRDTWPADRYGAMRRVANRHLTRGTSPEGSTSLTATRDNQETRIAVEILEESIMMGIAPGCEAERLAKAGKMSLERFHERILEIRGSLKNAPGLQCIAGEIMRTPTDGGLRVRAPRSRSPRLPQSELVKLPIG